MKNKKVPFVLPETPECVDDISSNLAGFYKNLGWNPDTSMLDVRKIKLTEKNYKELSNIYLSVKDAKDNISAFLISYMPSARGNSDGYVEIEEGAFDIYME